MKIQRQKKVISRRLTLKKNINTRDFVMDISTISESKFGWAWYLEAVSLHDNISSKTVCKYYFMVDMLWIVACCCNVFKLTHVASNNWSVFAIFSVLTLVKTNKLNSRTTFNTNMARSYTPRYPTCSGKSM